MGMAGFAALKGIDINHIFTQGQCGGASLHPGRPYDGELRERHGAPAPRDGGQAQMLAQYCSEREPTLPNTDWKIREGK